MFTCLLYISRVNTLFIREILNDLDEISHDSRMALNADDMQSSDLGSSQSQSDSDSSSSSLSSSSSSSSTASTGSTGTSLEESTGMSVDAAIDTDEERSIILGTAADLLQIITETRVLNPHLVNKCSQLDLILIDFKFHDPKHFQHNLQVSASTFDSLLEMIETHPVFLNDTYTSQSPVNRQLAVAMFWFGHNGNAASVEAVAQWAGVSAGTIVNRVTKVWFRTDPRTVNQLS